MGVENRSNSFPVLYKTHISKLFITAIFIPAMR